MTNETYYDEAGLSSIFHSVRYNKFAYHDLKRRDVIDLFSVLMLMFCIGN